MLYKRASALVAFWADGGPVIRNYARGTTVPLTPEILCVLQALDHWSDVEELQTASGLSDGSMVCALLDRLVEAGIIESPGRPSTASERKLRDWESWSPSAAFFHLDSKDVAYVDQANTAERASHLFMLNRPERTEPTTTFELPAYPSRGSFPSVLLSRRSWRRFGQQPVSLEALSTLLGLTWGVQRWMHVSERVRYPLKTSPSGGACHSLEVYVAASRVEGLKPGVYKYSPNNHGLAWVDAPWDSTCLTRHLAGQEWTAHAGAVFLMTSVFPRVQWKYKFARAYRTVLLEAGHFCQTFCLTATWLKLAPFCTAALSDSGIEQALGIDGISESVLYAMGVGSRPPGATWAPWADTPDVPDTTAPAHRQRPMGRDRVTSRRRTR